MTEKRPARRFRNAFVAACAGIVCAFAMLLFYQYFLADAATRVFNDLEARYSSEPREDSRREYTLAEYGYFGKDFDQTPYAYFRIQHLNPYYLFWFPYDAKERDKINNAVVSINNLGFRGPLPPKDKPLAFVLGSSTAFGYTASSEATTISGYLNGMQDKVYFINAAVPSWNSTQELFRLVNDVVKYKPALVVSYSFGSDILTANGYKSSGLEFEQGVPESFWQLQSAVDDIRGEFVKSGQGPSPLVPPRLEALLRNMFPELLPAPKRQAAKKVQLSDMEIAALAEGIVARYVQNQGVMSALGKSMGFRFLTIIEPMAQLHERLEPEIAEFRSNQKLFSLAVQKLRASDYCKSSCLDLSNVFDRRTMAVRVLDRHNPKQDLAQIVFHDRSHTLDLGNRIVAEEIAAALNLAPRPR
jgi:hypothetical protein